MRVTCIGGGPAGLYTALLLKKNDPTHDVTVFERNPYGTTQGWGVVFWDGLLRKLYRADPESARQLHQSAIPWDKQIVDVQGTREVFSGGGGLNINRQQLIDILVDRARAVGVNIEFGREVASSSSLPEADLIVASDGVNSRIRSENEAFETAVHLGSNKYIWLGTDKVLETFTFPFVRTDCGWIWAHAYPIDSGKSAFIVECSAQTHADLGFDMMPARDSLALLDRLFERHLDGHHFLGQPDDGTKVQWLNFRTITNKRWYFGKTVLVGDSAHTTSFSIGSGTTLAMEDALSLADNLSHHSDLSCALQSYERQRQTSIRKLQIDAHYSAQWFENIPRYIQLEPHQFATLVRVRRSPVLPYVSPWAYYHLYETSRATPGLRRVKRLGEPVARVLRPSPRGPRSMPKAMQPAKPISRTALTDRAN